MNSNEKVIEQFKKVHDDLYDYSLVNYINNTTKVNIICRKHGIFSQTPHHHKRGGGCPKCTKGKKALTNEEFIKKSKIIHNDKYDYSLVNYERNRDKVKIICKKHGIFEQNAAGHLRGLGCPKCGGKFSNKDKLLKIFKTKHKDRYKYNLDKDKYLYSDYIDIECSKHGKFSQKVMNHLTGSGCQKCGGKIYNFDDFEKKSNDIHNNKYDYSLSDYKKFNIPVKIICKKHGVFEQKPTNHFSGSGCPICRESKGEIKVRKFLIENNIKFISQKKFIGCVYKNKLPFDFYLIDYNTCIEFNGRQHYEPVDCFGGENEFDEIIKRDNIKREYCKLNNIKLVEINYKDINNIESILIKEIL